MCVDVIQIISALLVQVLYPSTIRVWHRKCSQFNLLDTCGHTPCMTHKLTHSTNSVTTGSPDSNIHLHAASLWGPQRMQALTKRNWDGQIDSSWMYIWSYATTNSTEQREKKCKQRCTTKYHTHIHSYISKYAGTNIFLCSRVHECIYTQCIHVQCTCACTHTHHTHHRFCMQLQQYNPQPSIPHPLLSLIVMVLSRRWVRSAPTCWLGNSDFLLRHPELKMEVPQTAVSPL